MSKSVIIASLLLSIPLLFTPSVVDCGGLSSPQNGQVILTNTTFGSIATYQCDDGFNLIGDMQRMCQSNGEWSGNEPTCEGNHSLDYTFLVIYDIIEFISVADCGFLMNPENGFVTINGRTFGSIATYQCDEGFILVGDMQRMCQINGEWSGNEPICES